MAAIACGHPFISLLHVLNFLKGDNDAAQCLKGGGASGVCNIQNDGKLVMIYIKVESKQRAKGTIMMSIN